MSSFKVQERCLRVIFHKTAGVVTSCDPNVRVNLLQGGESQLLLTGDF